ncbi:ankyrin repeat-containing domain protein [Mycena floridula]|nr:ankyrin repeat-containing domain protein [Mycena floridula]
MEAVGFGGTVFALAEVASAVFQYVKNIKEGPSNRADLQRSLAGLPGLLASLNAQFDSSGVPMMPDGPFDQLLKILRKVESKLHPGATHMEKVIQMLKWKLDKAEVTELMEKVERVKTFIMLAIQNDHVTLSRAIHQDVQHINIRVDQIADGARQIQAHYMNTDLRAFSEWMSPIDFQATQQSYFATCAPGTGHWLRADIEFQRWTASQIKTIWCPGNPGVGKTMLAYVIFHVSSRFLMNELDQSGVGVICIFFDYHTSSSQTVAEIFGSVIQQLLIDSSSISESLKSLHTTFKSGQSRPTSLSTLVEALEAQIQLYSYVYLVVDALNECSINIRDDFISTIQSLTESSHLSVLITSRDISTIAQEFTHETRIDVRAHDEDEDAVLKKEIVTQVTEKAAGMFLLVQLHLDSLASKNNRHALHQALVTLPKDIHRSYDKTMDRIMAQGEDDANLACQVFLWLTYAQERLTVMQLQHALAISSGMTEMNPDTITDIDILMAVCAGLVIVEEGHWNDHYPHFVHEFDYTTQEYFEHQENQKYFRDKKTEVYFELLAKPLSSDLFAHFHIVVTCVTHLAFEGLKLDDPLLHYSAEFWGYHARQCENMLCNTPKMAALLQNLLEDGFKDPSRLSSRLREFNLHFHSTRILGRFGLLQLTSMLVDHGIPINSINMWGKRTVLFYAVQKGHVDMVRWLLGAANEIGVPGQLFNINHADWDGKTLLHYAIEMKHPTIAEFLLGRPGINADVADNCGQTPLSYVVEAPYTQITDSLCRQADVNPNSYDNDGNPPLYYAICYNHTETVKILLHLPNIDVGPFQPSPRRYPVDLDAPLKVAAELGYLDIVDLLLKHPDIDLNWKGHGETPLAYAIMGGHLDVVDLLLQHSDIQPNLMSGPQDSEWDIPPLSYAVKEQRIGMVKRLLQHPDIDINLGDFEGWTPLSWAALCDYSEEIVEIPLQHPDIQPDIPDHTGKTPLMAAAYYGRESPFCHLFQSHKVTKDLVSPEDVGLLAYAACGGNQNIVHQVLELTSSSGCKDCHLCTPLSYAAVEGYQDVVQLLLEHDDFHNRHENDVFITEWFKRPPVVHLLLPDRKNSDPSSRYRQHFTTLINYALRWGHTEIAAFLCQHMETEDSLGVDSWN